MPPEAPVISAVLFPGPTPGLPLPAYDYVLKCSHAFNLLDARGVISATERMGYILRVRTIAKACCASYIEHVVGSTTQDGKEAEDGE